jgi:hypothetical protein
MEVSDLDAHVDTLVKRNLFTIFTKYGNNPETLERIRIGKENLLAEYKSNPNTLLNMALDKIRKNINENIGILSLSKINDNILMWSHYSDSHMGFVVGFDESHEFFRKQLYDRPDSGVLKDVIYSNEPIVVQLENISLPEELLYTKKTDWQYEREIRIVRELQFADKKDLPKNIYLFKIPENAIKEVIFGAKCESSMIDEIKNKISVNNSLSVIYKKADIDINGNFVITDFA